MSAAPKLDLENIRGTLGEMRANVLRLMRTADMVREGAVLPNWDGDVAVPTMQLNSCLSLLEELLGAEEERPSGTQCVTAPVTEAPGVRSAAERERVEVMRARMKPRSTSVSFGGRSTTSGTRRATRRERSRASRQSRITRARTTPLSRRCSACTTPSKSSSF